MAYLKGVENDLSSFSRFVRKADGILKKLKASSTNMVNQLDAVQKEPTKEARKMENNIRSKRSDHLI